MPEIPERGHALDSRAGQIGIPERYRIPLEEFATCDATEAEKLISALEREELIGTRPQLTSRFAAVSPDREWPKDLIEAMLSARTFAVVHSMTPEDAATELSSSQDLNLDGAARTTLARRLAQALDSVAIKVTSKAQDLQFAHQSILTDVRVVSDLRPVFDDENPKQRPYAAVISNILFLEVEQDGEIKTLAMSLDRSGLDQLRAAADRALDKMAALESLLHEAALPYVEFD